MILVDAGPLVALFNRHDVHHATCASYARTIREPTGTVWPALTEAMHLLSFSWVAQSGLFDFVRSEAVRILPIDGGDVPRIRELMKQYRDLPMDLADAALVRVAEREKIRTIFTVDRRDFALYRPKRIGKFRIVP